jgi:glycerol 3-phosphatase-1
MESQIPILYGTSAIEVPGSRAAVTALAEAGVPWAIVTSGTLALVTGWLAVLKLPTPAVLVSAESVGAGKPAPEGYLKARKLLGLRADAKVLVVEDAPAGIQSGRAAGFMVLGLATSHEKEEVGRTEADWVTKDMSSCRILGWDGVKKVAKVEIENWLVGRQAKTL